MADNYLDLDPHIQSNAHALQTGVAAMTERFIVRAEDHHKRAKYTRPDGAPIWDDVPEARVIDITDQVHAEYEWRVAK